MTFEECMKKSFMEIGVAAQTGTPAWKACKYVWDTAFAAGQQSIGHCSCTLAQKLTGDGCSVCNPTLKREIDAYNEGFTAGQQSVSCPDCLAKMAAKAAEAWYRFPTTKFVESTTIREQLDKILDELIEIESACNSESDERVVEESMDAIQALETLIKKKKSNIVAIAAQVERKNRERGYYCD